MGSAWSSVRSVSPSRASCHPSSGGSRGPCTRAYALWTSVAHPWLGTERGTERGIGTCRRVEAKGRWLRIYDAPLRHVVPGRWEATPPLRDPDVDAFLL